MTEQLARGWMTMAPTEPGGGSDLQAMTTTARRTDDGYVVNGPDAVLGGVDPSTTSSGTSVMRR